MKKKIAMILLLGMLAAIFNFAGPTEQVADYAYLSVSDGVQIMFIDGFLISIPMQKNSLLLIPAGEHVLRTQYYKQKGSSITFSKDDTELTFNFSAGSHYNLTAATTSNSITYNINSLGADQSLKGKKVITALSPTKGSPWAYHNIDTTKTTPLEGLWMLTDVTLKDGRSFKGNVAEKFFFRFNGNYFEYILIDMGLMNFKPTWVKNYYKAGTFELSGITLTLSLFAEYLGTADPNKRWVGIGWFIQNDIIDKHKTEKWEYILDGDTLTFTNGAMGNRAVLMRQR